MLLTCGGRVGWEEGATVLSKCFFLEYWVIDMITAYFRLLAAQLIRVLSLAECPGFETPSVR